jgi:predicted MPP superfamily phosphohydrolase
LKKLDRIVTILHISDLHRNEDGKVTNDQLFSSLMLDADNYSKTDTDDLPRPSVIIVSGDLIRTTLIRLKQ